MRQIRKTVFVWKSYLERFNLRFKRTIIIVNNHIENL